MIKFLIQKHFMFTEKKPRSRGIQSVSQFHIIYMYNETAHTSTLTADKRRTDS